jgi:hypothetical protein
VRLNTDDTIFLSLSLHTSSASAVRHPRTTRRRGASASTSTTPLLARHRAPAVPPGHSNGDKPNPRPRPTSKTSRVEWGKRAHEYHLAAFAPRHLFENALASATRSTRPRDDACVRGQTSDPRIAIATLGRTRYHISLFCIAQSQTRRTAPPRNATHRFRTAFFARLPGLETPFSLRVPVS